MSSTPLQKHKEEGFVLVTALLIMLLLTIIGIAMNNNTVTELQIAANDRLHKQSFYEADGATEFASEVIEQNIACLNFAENGNGSKWHTNATDGDLKLDDHIVVAKGSESLWQNPVGNWSSGALVYPSDTQRDMWLPPDYAQSEPHTNITVEAFSTPALGASIINAAGYLGLGRSASSGGVTLVYTIDSQRIGMSNSESAIRVEYHHVVGKEDPFCKYD